MKIKFPVIQWRTINISVEPKVETKVVEKAVEKKVEKPVTEPAVQSSIAGWTKQLKPIGNNEGWFNRTNKSGWTKTKTGWPYVYADGSNEYTYKDGTKPIGHTRERARVSNIPFWECLRGTTWLRATGKKRKDWELKYHMYNTKFQFACEVLNSLPPFTEEQILSQPKLFVKYLESKTKPNKYANRYANGHSLNA